MENNEFWRPVVGYENIYIVSNLGRVKNVLTSRFLKPDITNKGYSRITLAKNGEHKRYMLTHIIMFAFPDICGCYFDGAECSHLDENPQNNTAENLKWSSHLENINYGTHNDKVGTSVGKKVKCIETGVIYRSALYAKKITGVSDTLIRLVCRKKTSINYKGYEYIHKTAGGYHWEYA